MHTTEDNNSQTDEINKLAEEIGAKLAQARRVSGLSQWEFANRLGVPVYFTEILENGILVSDNDNHYLRWNGCPFTREELTRISNQLAKGVVSRMNVSQSDPETVFFCPITVNSNSIIDEIHTIAGQNDLFSFLMHHVTGSLFVKHRISYERICFTRGRKAAEAMKRRVSSVLSAHEKRLR